MTLTLTRTVYRLFGVPIASITRHRATLPDHLPTPTTPLQATGAIPILSDHGYAYSCRRCGELLLEGLTEPIAGADAIELVLHHNCQENPSG
ncbi:hypothetical protein [Nocardia pseudobrasiliensis]|uniref:Uncharacterized protein n=1 Tax=Nocardia pseudobrasiliensis TaxID=45979 RepID=A0A370I4U9_9NOCA|nr:hypothetical protein [Nocardia pseudobrasiliensis]RDI65725.1 hypothetical protein DFR76_10540 [Nocardia pseudobrasiliensis]